jgi:thiamine pyrophosphokinase
MSGDAGKQRPMHDAEQVDCVWVLASGPTHDIHKAIVGLPKPDKVVAANGGSSLAAELGLTPDLVVGDLDSSDPSYVAHLEQAGVELRRYTHDTKWETDTELAALAALQWQPRTIILLGAFGGRLDHSLANVLLLTHPLLAPIEVRIIDGAQEVFLAKPGAWNRIPGRHGDTATLLPAGGDAVGVKTLGLHWPLLGETLPQGRGRGVSNYIDETTGVEASVWLDSGHLLVVVLHE